jgi:hypothetical protein
VRTSWLLSFFRRSLRFWPPPSTLAVRSALLSRNFHFGLPSPSNSSILHLHCPIVADFLLSASTSPSHGQPSLTSVCGMPGQLTKGAPHNGETEKIRRSNRTLALVARDINTSRHKARYIGLNRGEWPASSTGCRPVNVQDNSTPTPWSIIFGTDHLAFQPAQKPTKKTRKFLFAADKAKWWTPAFPEPQSHCIGGTAHCHGSESCTWQQ